MSVMFLQYTQMSWFSLEGLPFLGDDVQVEGTLIDEDQWLTEEVVDLVMDVVLASLQDTFFVPLC